MSNIQLNIVKIMLYLLTLAILAYLPCTGKISDKRKCFDENCSVVISTGKTSLSYKSNDPSILSFPRNVDVKIYSKEAGDRDDLWGVEIGNQRGYVPKNFIREVKILEKDLEFIVPTTEPIKPIPLIENDAEPALPNDTESPLDKDNTASQSEVSNGENGKEEESTSFLSSSPTLSPLSNSNSNEFVDPNLVTPSYESIYDGTILPEYNEGSSNNDSEIYTMQNMQKSVENSLTENENPIDYSNIITSTLSSMVSGILGNSIIAESVESSSEEFVMLEDAKKEETIDEIQKTDDSESSSLNTSEVNLHSENIENVIKETVNDSVIKNDLVPASVDNDDSSENIISQEKRDVSEVDSAISDEEKFSNESEVSQQEENLSEPESSIFDPEKLLDENLFSEKVENIATEDNVFHPEKNRENIKNESDHHVEENSEVKEKEKSSPEIPKNHDVPKIENSFDLSDKTVENKIDLNNLTTKSEKLTDNEFSNVEIGDLSIAENLLNNKNLNIQEVSEKQIVEIATPFSMDNIDQTENVNPSDIESNENIETVTNKIISYPGKLSDQNNFEHQASSLHSEILFENDYDKEKENEENGTSNFAPEIIEEKKLNIETFDGNLNVIAELEEATSLNKDISKNDNKEVITDHLEDTINNSMQSNEDTSKNYLNNDVPIADYHSINTNSEPMTNNNVDVELLGDICDKDKCPKTVPVAESKEENSVFSETLEADLNNSYKLLYVTLTAITTLLFSLGYYLIENKRRDAFLIGKINELEKELMKSKTECIILDEDYKKTSKKLESIEDESFHSNETIKNLKSQLDAAKERQLELENQNLALEKELETAADTGLELQRMMHDLLLSKADNNALAQLEELQEHLSKKLAENENLSQALKAKSSEIKKIAAELEERTKQNEKLELQIKTLNEELKTVKKEKTIVEETLTENLRSLEFQLTNVLENNNSLSSKLNLEKLKIKELEEVIDHLEKLDSADLDIEKLYDVVQIKAEASHILFEKDELQENLTELKSNYKLLKDKLKSQEEEIDRLNEKCNVIEKGKEDAEVKLEVLKKFFEEKEEEREKKEAVWLKEQVEVASNVDRLQAMQKEIQNYKQQIEILKREILDQELKYKNQISDMETKAHEQWVLARQNERRLEDAKIESSQLRNRLTLMEKNMNDSDAEVKTHRMGTNGEIATTPSLFVGPGESSSSPVMFSSSSGIPPFPPPSYLYGPSFPHPFLPPPPTYESAQRLPPLGGRLSSPPPLSRQPNSRFDKVGSPPPSLSPPPLPFPPPPLLPYGNEHHSIHPPPPPLTFMPNPMHTWGDDVPPIRNSGFQSHQRDQRTRNHKGSLHSSGESLDKSHHSKV